MCDCYYSVGSLCKLGSTIFTDFFGALALCSAGGKTKKKAQLAFISEGGTVKVA